MRRTLKTLWYLTKMQLSSSMMYRASFWGALFADGSLFLIQLIFFGVISRNGSIGDWNIHHLTVFTGTFMALDGAYMATCFFGINALPDAVRTGELDTVLVKPVRPLLYLIFSKLNLGSLALFAAGLVISLYGGARLGLLSPAGVARYLALFALMYVLMLALMLMLRLPAFWFTRVEGFVMVENTLLEFALKLPDPAIQGAWRVLLCLVIPYGLAANLPAMALFGPLSPGQWAAGLILPFAFLGLCLLLWRRGMARYDSASS